MCVSSSPRYLAGEVGASEEGGLRQSASGGEDLQALLQSSEEEVCHEAHVIGALPEREFGELLQCPSVPRAGGQQKEAAVVLSVKQAL